MSDELTKQIAKIAELNGHPDLGEPKGGNALLNEALKEFYPDDTVRLKHLRKALNQVAGVGWDVLIQAKPIEMVQICSTYLEEGSNDEEASKKTPKKAPKNKATAKKKAPAKKDLPPEEPEESEKEEEPPKKSPKRRPVRRKKDTLPEEPREPTLAGKTEEVTPNIPAIEKYIDNKFNSLNNALLDVATPNDLQKLREEITDEHARTRAMLQQFYAAVYKMIADEDYIPPPELDEG